MEHTNERALATVGGSEKGSSLGTLGSLAIVPMHGRQKGSKKPSAGLLDLNALEVTVESEDDVERHIRAAQERSQFAQRAAQLIMQIRQRRKQLALIEEKGGTLTSQQKDEFKELDSKEQKILSHGDDELRVQVQFSLFIEDIRIAEPTYSTALSLLGRAVEMGRYRLATREEITLFRSGGMRDQFGVQFLDSSMYIPSTSRSPAQKALESELWKYLRRVKETMEREQGDAVNVILRDGNRNLDDLRNGIIGLYVLHLPEKKVAGEPTLHAGAAWVSLESKALPRGGEMLIIKVVSAAGKLEWMNGYKDKWISLTSFRRDRSDGNLPDDLLRFSDRFIRTLKASLSSWRRRHVEER